MLASMQGVSFIMTIFEFLVQLILGLRANNLALGELHLFIQLILLLLEFAVQDGKLLSDGLLLVLEVA